MPPVPCTVIVHKIYALANSRMCHYFNVFECSSRLISGLFSQLALACVVCTLYSTVRCNNTLIYSAWPLKLALKPAAPTREVTRIPLSPCFYSWYMLMDCLPLTGPYPYRYDLDRTGEGRAGQGVPCQHLCFCFRLSLMHTVVHRRKCVQRLLSCSVHYVHYEYICCNVQYL